MVTSTPVAAARKKAFWNNGTGNTNKIGEISKNYKNSKNRDKNVNLGTNLAQVSCI